MQKFVIQWHITDKCNLRCKHCYQEDYCNDLKIEQLEEIFKQIKNFFINNNFNNGLWIINCSFDNFLIFNCFPKIRIFMIPERFIKIMTN